MFGKRQPGIEIETYRDVTPRLIETAEPAVPQERWFVGNERGILHSPFHGPYFFKTAVDLRIADSPQTIRKGTPGEWRSFIPKEALMLEEDEQQRRPIHFVEIGERGNITKVTFEVNNLKHIEIAAFGLMRILKGGEHLALETQRFNEEAYTLWEKNHELFKKAIGDIN